MENYYIYVNNGNKNVIIVVSNDVLDAEVLESGLDFFSAVYMARLYFSAYKFVYMDKDVEIKII